MTTSNLRVFTLYLHCVKWVEQIVRYKDFMSFSFEVEVMNIELFEVLVHEISIESCHVNIQSSLSL